MGSTTTMRSYFWEDGDEIVVQNMVGGYKGQEHRHSKKDFDRWKKKRKKAELK